MLGHLLTWFISARGFCCRVTLDGVPSGLWRYRPPSPLCVRKRGNPNWGRPTPPARALATEFELRVRQLQLKAEMYASSLELRTWCKQNRNRCYVPEWLLAEWCITVDPYFSGESEYPRVTQFARSCHRTRTVGSV